MTLSIVKTPAEEALGALLKASQSALPGKDFASKRADALALFDEKGLPNRRVEEWKYSDLKRVMPKEITLAGEVSLAQIQENLDSVPRLRGLERSRLMLVNGQFRADLSDMAELEGKVSITSVASALEDGSFTLDDPEITKGDHALNLNTALLQDGVIIEIAEGVELEKPIEILSLMIGGGLATSRNRVVLGKNAKAFVMETFVGDNEAYQVNEAIDYRIADGASLHATRMLSGGKQAIHVGSTTAILGAESRFEHFTMSVGGSFTRNTAFVKFTGEFSDAELFGATIIGEKQHSDTTLLVDHAVPNCNSKEQYRTVMDDQAQGVFQGKIFVRQPAQKTDGQMMSQALLLSEDAAFFNKPELEIFADDVQCAHGATCGELDEDLLFYLRARGIPMAMAKKMLVLAFLAEAIEHVSNDEFVESLEGFVANWLGLDH
ncbi:MAG: Fe-S cluster assembly protein SufD [Cohaesibacter sp.]|jgi:Fe-S cluster assembly protein SufD|nr:Fe-S cluster assembly protein SufD [Cohaesibacter sp.]